MIMRSEDNRRKYEKPSMRVFELHGRCSMILCGSGTNGSRSPYGDPTEWDWE